jgi:hypothetical protein
MNRQHIFKRTDLTSENFCHNVVLVLMEDGTTMRFKYAFYCEEGDYYAVYTEHSGYYAIPKYGGSVVAISTLSMDEGCDNYNHMMQGELAELFNTGKLNHIFAGCGGKEILMDETGTFEKAIVKAHKESNDGSIYITP